MPRAWLAHGGLKAVEHAGYLDIDGLGLLRKLALVGVAPQLGHLAVEVPKRFCTIAELFLLFDDLHSREHVAGRDVVIDLFGWAVTRLHVQAL